MSRENAIARAEAIFDDSTFFDLLTRWVSHPTESQNEACQDTLRNYLTWAITPYLIWKKRALAAGWWTIQSTPGCPFWSAGDRKARTCPRY
jgi:hypothetical protein